MRLVLTMAAALVPLAAFAAASRAPAPRAAEAPPATPCPVPKITFAQDGSVARRVQKLGELPAANHYLAVERRVGGCPEAAVVRTGIGGRRE